VATEIERKFLLLNDHWRAQAAPAVRYRQGYLSGSKKSSVRVRIEGEVARLNIKSATLGVTRREYEYAIPVDDATEILKDLCDGPLIDKLRYHVQHGAHLWEIDVFEGDNAGLVVAEIELSSEDEPFARPDWLGAEVSQDARYYNVCLAQHPFKNWNGNKIDEQNE
jgi:adenylate cyclase